MKISRPLILDGFFLLLLVALTIAFFQVLRPFFLDIFLAVILTTLTYRMFAVFNGKLKPRLSAFLCILIIFILVAGFGASSNTGFGGNTFGKPAAGGLFGAPAPAPGGLFGSPAPAPAFGAPGKITKNTIYFKNQR